MKPFLLPLLLLLTGGLCSAQKSGQALIDSLLSVSRYMPEDSNGVMLMDAIAGSYNDINPDEGLLWAMAELVLAQKNRWRRGRQMRTTTLATITRV